MSVPFPLLHTPSVQDKEDAMRAFHKFGLNWGIHTVEEDVRDFKIWINQVGEPFEHMEVVARDSFRFVELEYALDGLANARYTPVNSVDHLIAYIKKHNLYP